MNQALASLSSPAFNPTSFWNEFDLLFKDLFDSSSGFSIINQNKIHYPVDIRSMQNGIVIDIAIVGVDKKDVQIDVEDDILRVSHKAEISDKSPDKYLHRGITKKAFNFAWKLSSKLNLNAINATMDKGILSIEIPYKEEKTKRSIDIV